MKISESLKKGSGTVAAGKAPDTAILRPRAGTFVEVTSVKTITDSSTENPWMALQALQIQQARNITRPPTQNLLFHPSLPLRVDSNIPATSLNQSKNSPDAKTEEAVLPLAGSPVKSHRKEAWIKVGVKDYSTFCNLSSPCCRSHESLGDLELLQYCMCMCRMRACLRSCLSHV